MFTSSIFENWLHANTFTSPTVDGKSDQLFHSWIVRKLKCAPCNYRVLLVQAISLFRIVATLCFASLALSNISKVGVTMIYCLALISDLLDGYLARRLRVASYFGRVMDLVADKSLTIVSLLFAAQRGISLLPLAMIVTRETITLGLRLVQIEGRQILRTNRIFGGIMAMLLGINTLLLLSKHDNWHNLINISYWLIAVVFTVNLAARFSTASSDIGRAILADEQTHVSL